MRSSRPDSSQRKQVPPAPARPAGTNEHAAKDKPTHRSQGTAKDVNVVRGDDKPQAVRHPR